MVHLTNSLQKVWHKLDGWAGHKLTNSWSGKGKSEGKSLDNGTCQVSQLAYGDESEELEDAGDTWRS